MTPDYSFLADAFPILIEAEDYPIIFEAEAFPIIFEAEAFPIIFETIALPIILFKLTPFRLLFSGYRLSDLFRLNAYIKETFVLEVTFRSDFTSLRR